MRPFRTTLTDFYSYGTTVHMSILSNRFMRDAARANHANFATRVLHQVAVPSFALGRRARTPSTLSTRILVLFPGLCTRYGRAPPSVSERIAMGRMAKAEDRLPSVWPRLKRGSQAGGSDIRAAEKERVARKRAARDTKQEELL